KIEQFSIENEQRALEVQKALNNAASGSLDIAKIEKKQRRRRPAAPFTTSTLQQEASRKLSSSAQKTMRTAQGLYEDGLITYMRTDSVTLANEALADLRSVIAERYGKKNVPDEPNFYKTKAKNAQEAHEAIRPTSAAQMPESLKDRLDADQLKLYTLIWQRAVACQMIPAVYDTVSADLLAGPDGDKRHRFRASGSTLVEPGFIAVYQEGEDNNTKPEDDDKALPPLEEGESIPLQEIRADQHFTEPPPRYTEASLVKTLEEYGIGRPSTYASIISTLRNRDYVEIDRRRFTATDVGRVVNRFLTQHFTQYVDYDFTARMEDDLDAISRGEQEWIPVLDEFWEPFNKLVQEKEASVTREDASQARELGTDPKSGRPVIVRMGRYGPFVQIGHRDDEEKPKFAGLRPGQKMDQLDLKEALELFKLPRKLGTTPDGEEVSTSIGRYGPYVKYGDKFVSMREDDPYTIGVERALELIEEKKIFDANRIIQDFEEEGIQVLNGRYGPYITNKKKNAKVPKDKEPKELTLEECKELLANAPERGRRRKKKNAATNDEAAATKKKPARKKKKKKRKKKKAASKKEQ
ncbi:MAG: DNA topoisomerase, partial [Gammaproteobacteria bacterium]